MDASASLGAGAAAPRVQAGAIDAGVSSSAPPPQQQRRAPPPPPPTHFLSLRVSNSSRVVEAISEVQRLLVAHSPGLAPCLVDPHSAHLTLLVMTLRQDGEEEGDSGAAVAAETAAAERAGTANEDATTSAAPQLPPPPPLSIADATNCLRAFEAVLRKRNLLRPLDLQLSGLSHFRSEVLFLNLAAAGDNAAAGREQLAALADAAAAHFEAAGVVRAEGRRRAFAPHVTVAKTSRLLGSSGGRGSRGLGRYSRGGGAAQRVRIEREAYAAHADIDAGAVRVEALHLCAMGGRASGEYYRVVASLPLGGEEAAAVV